MQKFFEIIATAENTVFHRHASLVLDGDNEFSESSRSTRREFRDEADAVACFDAYVTQAQADTLTYHTDVTFELCETCENEDGDYTQRILKSLSFKVQAK